MKRFFKVLTVAQLALTAYNYYMEHRRDQRVKELKNEIERAQLAQGR